MTINGVEYELNADGTVNIDTRKLAAGNYTVTATIYESDKYLGNSTTETFTVFKHGAVIDSIVVPSVNTTVGQNVTITVVMGNVADGSVIIEVGSHNYTVSIVNGNATLTVGLPVGNDYVAHAYYLESDKFNATGKVSSGFNITDKLDAVVVINAPSVVVVDGKLVFNVTNSTPVVVTINGAVYTPVDGNYTFDAKVAGNYTIVARSDATDEYNAGFDSTVFVVVKLNSTVNITVDKAYEIESKFNITVGNSTMVNVTINGVEYELNADGTVKIDTRMLAAGNYTVTATIYESDKYLGNSTTKTFTVFKHNAVIDSIVVPSDNVGVGKNATITVNMGNVTGGYLLIEVGNHNYTVEIAGKVAVLNVVLPVGKYTARAYYLESDMYNATVSALSAEFTVADKKLAIINIAAPGVVEVDHNITFTVDNVTPVNVTVNGVKVELKDGKYNYNVTEVGVATIVVRSNATDEYYAGFNSTTVNVIKHNSTVDITVGKAYEIESDFTIKVDSNTAVNVTINGVEYELNADGTVDIVTRLLAAGNYTVTATVYESDKYYGNSTTETFTVFKHNAVIDSIVVPSDNVGVGKNATITVNMGNVTGGYLLIEVGNHNYTVEIAGKVAVLNVVLPVGKYTARAYYLESDMYNATVSALSAEFTVADKKLAIINIAAPGVVEVDHNITFTVDNVTPVNVTVNGVKVELKDGKYSYNATLVGTATIIVTSVGNDEYLAGFNYTAVSVIKHNATIGITVNPTYYVGDEIEITVSSNVAVINVTVNGKVYPVNNNKVIIPANESAAGKYIVTATVYENDKFMGNTTTEGFEIIRHKSQVNVTVAPIDVGRTAVINITAPDYNGSAIVNVNGNNYSVIITDGIGQLNITGLANGTYDVSVTYLENDRYDKSTNATTLVVSKVASFVDVEVKQISVGENEVIIFNVPGDATGNITVVVDGKTYYVPVSGGKGTLTIEGLQKGDYDVNATYNGDGKYLSSLNDTQTFKVIYESSEMSVVDEKNGTIVVYLHDNATGNVSVEIDGEVYLANVTDGVAYVTLTNTTPGNYTAYVVYSGDGEFNRTETYVDVVIPKYETTMAINASEFMVGDIGYIDVTLPNGTSGMVIIEIDGKSLNSTDIINGVVRFEIGNLTAGNKTFVVKYSGDRNYMENSTVSTLTVSKHDSAISVVTADIEAGSTAQINITGPADIDGVVVVNINGLNYTVILNSGEGTLDITGLPAGRHDIAATYLENDKYKLSTNSSATLTVSKVLPDIEVSVENITYGENAVFEITLPADAEGNLTIIVSDTVNVTVGVIGGVNRILVDNIPIGVYSNVNVTYNGNYRYLSNSYITSLKVDPQEIKDGISIEDLGNKTVIVHVPEGAEGNVTVEVNGHTYSANITNGTAVITLEDETPGVYDAVVIYSGDATHANVTLNTTVRINKYLTPISIEVNDTKVGGKAVVVVEVPESIIGNVTIEIDGINHTAKVDHGVAIFEVENITAGNKTVTAVYAGDDSYQFNSTTQQFKVYKNTAPLSVTVNTTDGVVVEVLDLPSDATGYVVVEIDGVEYAINISSTRQITIPFTKPGTYIVAVTYLGDDKYLANKTSENFTIKKIPVEPEIVVENTTTGSDVIVKVTIPDDATGNITVTIEDITKVVNATGGENIITIPGVSDGTHEVTVTYSGDDNYTSKTVITNVTVSTSIVVPSEHVTRGWDSPYDYQSQFLDKNGNVLPNIDVQFIVNGKTYTARTDSEGIAYLTDSNLGVGTYDITVINPVTGQILNNKLTIVKRLVECKDITMDFADGTYYTVRAIGDDGNPVGEGEFVSIKVNGIGYPCKTDKNGYARLKINLNPGKYTVTAEYKNSVMNNKLKVKQTLKLVKKTVKVKKGKKLVLKAKLKWTLKSNKNKSLKGKKIIFKFKGKKYKAKTNKKGIAKVTIKTKVTKKLKKGKKYAYTATYLTNTVKGKVKIK